MSRSRFAVVSLALTAGLVAHASMARAQVPLLDGFGGTRNFGTQCLGPNDDGSSSAVDLTPIFPSGLRFFGRTHTVMYVNTNGNVTFGGGLAHYTPEAFPVADQPMIAPFWADVDIRFDPTDCEMTDGGGAGGACHDPTANGVWWTLDVPNRRVIVTWDQVGYFDCHTDKRMSFQLVLTAAPESACAMAGDFDVEFRFNRCEWNTGDASGGQSGLAPGVMDGVRRAACITVPVLGEQCPEPGNPCVGGMCDVHVTPAQSGFDAGNSTDWVEIPGSRTNDIHTILCTDSNVGTDGLWRFQVRTGSILCPDAGDACDTGAQGACGLGRTACVRGETECRQDVQPSAERCDAIDNDCNGVTDDGDGLCPLDQVCDRGICISRCFEGGCAAGQTCSASGQCVDPLCADVSCPFDERCYGGVCVGACDFVVCPGDGVCVGGQCVDACAGTTCDDCTVCERGACVARCAGDSCGAGQECAADGRCVDTGCAALTCGADEVCRGGACVDACQGAVCPDGQVCQGGACVPSGTPGVDGGVIVLPDGAIVGFDGGPGGGRDRPRGCSCRAAGVGGGGAPWALLALLGIVIARRRARR